MHVHTAPYSACGGVKGEDMVKLYKDAGFDGIFVTNHYMKWALLEYYGMPLSRAVERFLKGYKIAKEAGDKIGLEVHLGMELSLEVFNEPDVVYPYCEMLVYGMTEELLRANREIYNFTPKKLYEFCQNNNLFFAQSHPFRTKAKRADIKYLMGVEAYNANVRHYSDNETAERYADEHKLIKIYSDDFHEPEDVGRAATMFPDDCKEPADYVNALRSGRTRGIILR